MASCRSLSWIECSKSIRTNKWPFGASPKQPAGETAPRSDASLRQDSLETYQKAIWGLLVLTMAHFYRTFVIPVRMGIPSCEGSQIDGKWSSTSSFRIKSASRRSCFCFRGSAARICADLVFDPQLFHEAVARLASLGRLRIQVATLLVLTIAFASRMA
jgi:hypothetical protein